MTGPSHQKEQLERLEILLSDRKALRPDKPDTLHNHQASDLALEQQGRFAKASTVVGTTPTVQYPAGPNWSAGPAPGVEPPLAFDVNELEPVGTAQEIAASLSAPGNRTDLASERESVDASLIDTQRVLAEVDLSRSSPATDPSAINNPLGGSPSRNNPRRRS